MLLRPGRVIDGTVGGWRPKATFRRSTVPTLSYRCALGSWSAGPTITGATRTALDIATGKRVGDLPRRHRSPYFLRLPQRIDAQVPQDPGIDLELDSYGPHKSPAVRRRLLGSPRVQPHFSPTHSSWINWCGAGWARWPNARSDAAYTPAPRRRARPLAYSSPATTSIPSPLSGSKRSPRFSPAGPAFAAKLCKQDARRSHGS